MKYNKAPLPFLGQKRNFLKIIRQLDFKDYTVVDLFGGSGLLSHTIQDNNPNAHVIYNDFDFYHSRLEHIEETEKLRQILYAHTKHLQKNTKISGEFKFKLLNIIKQSNCEDWITISSWLLFSGRYSHSFEELSKAGWYSRVTSTPLKANGYLSNVVTTHQDFRTLLSSYESHHKVFFVADPPYIMTNQSGYAPAKNNEYFRLRDAIDLVRSIHQYPCLFFSSAKSETEDLFRVWSPKQIKKINYQASIGGGTSATEHLFFLNCDDIFSGSIKE